MSEDCKSEGRAIEQVSLTTRRAVPNAEVVAARLAPALPDNVSRRCERGVWQPLNTLKIGLEARETLVLGTSPDYHTVVVLAVNCLRCYRIRLVLSICERYAGGLHPVLATHRKRCIHEGHEFDSLACCCFHCCAAIMSLLIFALL